MPNEEDELPGMLALEIAVAKQQWPHTIDARTWADEWLKTLKERPEIATDKDTMIGWFANAIMAGYDTANQRSNSIMPRQEKRTWIVRVKCEVIKELVCEDCTEAQAWQDPWDYVQDECEIDQLDWEVKSVKENS